MTAPFDDLPDGLDDKLRKEIVEKLKQAMKAERYDTRPALRMYAEILELDPNIAIAWNRKGRIIGIMGLRKEAIECFNKSIEINPHDENAADAWIGKGRIYREYREYERALGCFTAAAEIAEKLHDDKILKEAQKEIENLGK